MTTTLRRRLAALALAAALACCALAAPAAFADGSADADGGATADLMATVAATGYCGDSTTDYIQKYGERGYYKIGKNVMWTVYTNGLCVISGKGGMSDYSISMTNMSAPSAQGVTITRVEIQEGVTSVGSCLWWGNKTITSIDLASTVTSVGNISLPSSPTSGCTVTVRNLSLYNTIKYGSTDYLKNYYCGGYPADSYKTTNPTVKFEFRDVTNSSEWYYDSVHAAAKAGYILGFGDGTFGATGTLTRAQAATILWRYYTGGTDTETTDTTGMADMKNGQWYTAAANWAVKKGVINGFGNADGTKSFSPDGTITREQLCAIVANASAKLGPGGKAASYSKLSSMADASSVDSWAKESVAWALTNGVISGKATGSSTLRAVDPLGKVTRAEMAAILMNSVDAGLLK